LRLEELEKGRGGEDERVGRIKKEVPAELKTRPTNLPGLNHSHLIGGREWPNEPL